MAVRIAGSPPASRPDTEFYLNATDDALMAAFQSGDALAFYALLERHTGMIWKLARQYFGPKAEVDDLTQDLTLTLWQKRDAWKPGTAQFSTWLYRVVSNRCIDIVRQKQILSHDGILPDHLASHTSSAEENVERRQLADQMSGLLSELPASQKTALTLFYYEDASLPQIASRLKVSELAARSLLKRGKQKLRTMMAADAA